VRPEIGAVGAKLYYEGNWIQHAGVILGLGGVAGHGHRFFPRESRGCDKRLATTQNFSAVTGACMVLRRSVYWQVGGLNETDLKIAFNDVDLCLNIRAAGYRIVWTPDAELYHHESASRGQDDTLEKRQRFEAERGYMRRRWQAELARDPYYSPFLTMEREDFSLAQVPRPCKPWLPVSGRRHHPGGDVTEPRFTRRPR
jgi:GT2 family glycosyltransferase